jgi:hypothetical protein
MPAKTFMIQPDPFKGRAEKVADYIPSATDSLDEREQKSNKPFANAVLATQRVGRPLQGISVKPNTAAFAQVIGKDGEPRALLNQLGGRIDNGKVLDHSSTEERVWTDWFLQTVREERSEKTQLLETFGETYLFAFGQKPRTLVFQGTLMNTLDFNWRATFWENWDAEFRATQLIKNEARMYISWDDVLVEGYPINAVTHQVSDSPNAMVFSFTFFVTNYISLAARRKWAGEKQQAIPLASFRDRVPQPKDGELKGLAIGQEVVQLTGLRGVRTLAGLASNKLAGLNYPGSDIVANLAHIGVNYAGNLVAGLALTVNTGEQWNSLLGYETARFSRDVAETLLYGGAGKLGLSAVEVNMWFGYASVLARRADDVFDGLDLTYQLGGDEEEIPISIDALIQRLGYGVQHAMLAVPGATETAAPPVPRNPPPTSVTPRP